MSYDAVVLALARGVEVIGVGALIVGSLVASGIFLREWRSLAFGEAYHRYRANLGRAILLGLEILIVADIIGTVSVAPTLENVSVLGLIVLIRTFLSVALEVEISGVLPWRRTQVGPPHHPGSGD